ncbi:MAG: EAL domain-containing protein [Epulopiscium sp.]|nr:EAL domain-containing protein [Candidatus Epulonipiscium sp.]
MFIARQPIFNKIEEVYGYELLFRLSDKSNKFDGPSSKKATASVIGGLFEVGLEEIVGDKYAFVNFDEEFIHSDSIELISPDTLVIEMLENISIDDKLINRIIELKEKGYKIALDDFVEEYNEYPIVPYANIIKYDLMETPLGTIEDSVKRALEDRKIILAEKVETKEEFLEAREMGFHLFQGYFFSRPNIVEKSSVKASSKSQYVRILWELKKEEPSYDNLSRIIEQDVNLAYRFMRVISHRSNNTLFDSIKRGLTFMGFDEIERWITILMLQDYGKEKPQELIKTSLVRTKFAEGIALQGSLRKNIHEASMMGLFSTLDAVLDKTMEEALEGISLTNNIKEALIEHKGILYPVYKLLLAYEQGDWEEVEKIASNEQLGEDALCHKYLESIKWANEISLLIA